MVFTHSSLPIKRSNFISLFPDLRGGEGGNLRCQQMYACVSSVPGTVLGKGKVTVTTGVFPLEDRCISKTGALAQDPSDNR